MSSPTCLRSAFSTAQFFSLAIIGASLLSISVSWSQDWRSPGAQRCAVINCNGPAPAIRRPPPPPREPSAAELAREALDAAHEQAYSEIQAAMANHDYANALSLAKYQQALPDGLDFREFIKQMELYLLRNSAADAYTAGDFDRSAALFRQALQQDPEDQYARSNLELAEGRAEMARDANALANTVQDRRIAPAVAGVDFSSVDIRPVSTDTSVVDARNVPTGLPASVAAEIPATPAGDRVRKGFEAILNHDWPVALAFFQEAASLEPGNPGLQRLVDLAQDGVARTPARGRDPAQIGAGVDVVSVSSGMDAPTNPEFLHELERFNKAHPPVFIDWPPIVDPSALASGSSNQNGSPGGDSQAKWKPMEDPMWAPLFHELFGDGGIAQQSSSESAAHH